MMGKLFIEKILKLSLLVVVISTMGYFLGSHAYACSVPNGGQIQNTLPGNYVHPPSEFGDRRPNHKSGPGKHTGTDFFLPNGSEMAIPQGCKIQANANGNIVWEQNSKKANGEPAGYGYYMVLDCGTTASGQTVKMRIAHLPKNPYNAGTKKILQGASGNAAGGAHHFHIETIIGDRPVDTQCVLGIPKSNANADGASETCKKCPSPTGNGSANLCDNATVTALINHGSDCTGGARKSIAGGTTVDPNTITGSGVASQPDPDAPPMTGPHVHDGDGGGTDYSDDPVGGPGHTPIPPPDDPNPPEQPPTPPPPETPGQPGGSAELVPEAKESPEELAGCASDTWTAMVNQAVMETRREDILNKRFILKPDSVLDYSCFDFFVKKVADKAGPVFSESKHWAARTVDLYGKSVVVKRELGSKSLDNALMDVVQSTLINYRRGQFNNKFLADSEPVDATAGQENCDVMAKVWKVAKCKNFENAPTIYYTFKDLTKTDPREFPSNMKCD